MIFPFEHRPKPPRPNGKPAAAHLKAFTAVDNLLRAEINSGAAPAAQLAIYLKNELVFSEAYGHPDPTEPDCPTTRETRFDLASVTKLFTTTLFMMQVQQRRVRLNQPVRRLLPEFSGARPIRPYEDPLAWSEQVDMTSGDTGTVETRRITFRQLLTHTSGLPAWRPLHLQPNADAARAEALNTFFACRPNTRVLYSDIGLILLGMAVERLYAIPLAEAVRVLICDRLGLAHTGFQLIPNPAPEKFAPTEYCQWRGRRVRGEVHDENAWRLGGAAGHAGLFSTAEDLARFGQMFASFGYPLIKLRTLAAMVQEQAREGAVRRGLGFHLWSPDPEASSHPFSDVTFGHTGFTGTCLWIDMHRALVVAFLTNEVYNGRANRQIGPLRLKVMQAVVDAVDAANPSTD